MIEIKPEDVGRKIFDMWTRKWLFIVSVERDCVNIHGIPCFIKNDGMYDGAPRFAWEKTPLPELRKRPKEKKKIDLWIGVYARIGGYVSLSTTAAYESEEAARNALHGHKAHKRYGVHKITIEEEE